MRLKARLLLAVQSTLIRNSTRRNSGVVQNQVTKLWTGRPWIDFGGPSAMPVNWRKAKKARTSSIFTWRPPSASQLELAEGVIFPEKNADFWSWRPAFGGGGPPVGMPDRLMAV
jgi:hypothetical protein